jgi:hypothetical protein
VSALGVVTIGGSMLMGVPMSEQDGPYSDEEAARRRDEVIKRMVDIGQWTTTDCPCPIDNRADASVPKNFFSVISLLNPVVGASDTVTVPLNGWTPVIRCATDRLGDDSARHVPRPSE